MDQNGFASRKWLRHDIPCWVPADSIFYITVCAKNRDSDDLLDFDRGFAIRDAAHFYHDSQKWRIQIMVIMPDHLHFLTQFPFETDLARLLKDWKRYLNREHGIRWQPGFFDHRIRSDEALNDKAEYIRRNPVKAGLVENSNDWPWLFGEWINW